ncbi:b(0,+)-type amino acid transporter 1-like isoform X1 [Mizuhopecten yessoensis]|nr:b(0,+)-type amino acid transporter 1-like isoform X1 [Mizuhopecten yessoensis]XP_021352771.1 b(0,+)-type amino acid transporter 1-like isoform X1 [Mizuhopecten yessoensis]XP_021352772.1 b(0,+)-type amino acid transporter 1-like isoform X1 [Mizuhopecten yessoensis]
MVNYKADNGQYLLNYKQNTVNGNSFPCLDGEESPTGTMINGHINGDLDKLKYRSNGNNNSGEITPVKQHVNLKKRVGLTSGIALIVGTMIGSGIFISPKGVLMGTGSVGLSIIVWVGCGVLSLMGALSYAELGTMITRSGAEYAYLKEAFEPMHKTLGSIPAFMYAWTSVLILKPALFGVVAMSFALYSTEPFYPCGPPEIVIKLVSVACLFVVSFINCYSVSLATKVQNVFTVTKLVAVAVITVGGFVMISRGETEVLETGFEGTENSMSMIALAFYDGLWAYDGWNNLNYVTEEIQDPHKNLPRAIMIAIPLVTVCYFFTNISYLTVMTTKELLASAAVATTWGERVLGGFAMLIPISVAFSTFGAANGSCFTGGRVMFVAAREGHLPEVLSYVHVKQYTPLPSLLFSTALAAILVTLGDIFTLIDYFSFAAWFFYGATMAALLVLRYTSPDRERPYKVPIIVPVIVLLFSIYLVVAPIVQNPRIEFLYAFLFMISGLFFYVPFVVYKTSFKFTEKVTRFLQLVLLVAPSRYEQLVAD